MSSGSDFIPLQQRLQVSEFENKPLKRKYESSSSQYDGPIILRKGNRYGFPELPSNDLIRTHAVPVDHPRIEIWTHAKQQAAILVDEEGIDFNSISVLMRRESDDSESAATIIIDTPNLIHRDKWSSVLVSIAKMLYTIKALDMHVEISFFEPEISKGIYAIPWDHPCVSIWNVSMRDQVLGLLQHSPWNTVSMFLYGQDLPSAKPTIIITTADINHSSWITVQEQLRHSSLHNSDLDLQLVKDDLIGAFQSHNDHSES